MLNTMVMELEHAGDGLTGLERKRRAGSGNRNGEGRTGRHERGSSGFEVWRCWRSGNEREEGRFEGGMDGWLLLPSVEIAADPADVCMAYTSGERGRHENRCADSPRRVLAMGEVLVDRASGPRAADHRPVLGHLCTNRRSDTGFERYTTRAIRAS